MNPTLSPAWRLEDSRRDKLRSLALVFPLDWRIERRINLPANGLGRLGPYYVEWLSSGIHGEDWDRSPYDSDGVILLLRGGVYHPVRIAQYGLQQHACWLRTRSPENLRRFLANARWLRDNQQRHHGIEGCYEYDSPEPYHGALAGWISALAQGQAISLLLRAAQERPDDGFGEAAARAAQPFRHDIKDGGVVWRSVDGDVFFEEYAVASPPHILNGALYALWGLLEFAKKSGEGWAGDVTKSAVATLVRRLPAYDAGYWSYYSAMATPRGFRRVSTLKYHAFHIAQLRVTAALTNERTFLEFAARWRAYQKSWLCRCRVWLNMACWLALKYSKLDTFAGTLARSVFAQTSPAVHLTPNKTGG